MKNATYVDQSDTIRTLTEEELAVVSGGMTQSQLMAEANAFKHTPLSAFIPKTPRGVALAFRALYLYR
jgi:bacteriocin-like protein